MYDYTIPVLTARELAVVVAHGDRVKRAVAIDELRERAARPDRNAQRELDQLKRHGYVDRDFSLLQVLP